MSDSDLDTLVGPLALYPDDLVAVILSSSTYPVEIVQVDRFTDRRKMLSREHYTTHEHARRRIFSFLEGWYNVPRLHSSIGYCSPLELENLSAKTKTVLFCELPTDGQRRGRTRRLRCSSVGYPRCNA
ncbi:hypothetical protein AWB67_07182 [Caballeronia terrestris]|uniref:Integrase catalytic domain-containing protein n=1 Tax=Caballeronia terrestris TaxID=1226301 RepID=A0A158L078_9BURK|nr:DUF3300 domain-containing protein [Caballeronia terrestris]SAL86383.1 hypothetical protein AWB67_07182 [Caballeronia terrestris]